MKELKITAEIDLMENAVYVVIEGQLTKVTSKPIGEDIIIWQNGRVLDVIRSESHRLKGKVVI